MNECLMKPSHTTDNPQNLVNISPVDTELGVRKWTTKNKK